MHERKKKKKYCPTSAFKRDRFGRKSRFEMQPRSYCKLVTLAWKNKKRKNTAGSNRETVIFEKKKKKRKLLQTFQTTQTYGLEEEGKNGLLHVQTLYISHHIAGAFFHTNTKILYPQMPQQIGYHAVKKERVIVIYNSKSGKRTLCADVWSDDKAHKYSPIYFCFPALSSLSDLTKTILCCSELSLIM